MYQVHRIVDTNCLSYKLTLRRNAANHLFEIRDESEWTNNGQFQQKNATLNDSKNKMKQRSHSNGTNIEKCTFFDLSILLCQPFGWKGIRCKRNRNILSRLPSMR